MRPFSVNPARTFEVIHRPGGHGRSVSGVVMACCAAVALLGASAAPASARTAPHWTIRDLGTLNGGLTSEANAVNDRGDIVGRSNIGPAFAPSHAVLWRNGRIIDLGTLAGGTTSSGATDINNRGEIVGWSVVPGGAMHAFLWRDGRMTDLGTLGGSMSYASAINDRGQVAGYSQLPGGAMHAVLWSNGRRTDLGTLNGGWSEAMGINNAGVVVGTSSVDGMNSVPVRFWHGTVTKLTSSYGLGQSINGVGQVAGYYYGGNGAFLWTRGRLTGVGPAHSMVQVYGVNDRGQVVGYTAYDAFVWQQGRMTTLPRLKSTSGASAINNRGVVVGSSSPISSGGNAHAVIWTLTPAGR
jgi:probable HAF family extracellular repeat protein